MIQKPSNKMWIVGWASVAAIIIAAIIGLGMPFAENIAARYLPPFTPTPNSPMTNPTIFTNPTPVLAQDKTPALCYGQCWQYNDNAHTMVWTGSTDGLEDIWQPQGEALIKIRDGYSASITTSVPGEIFACVLSINGSVVKKACDGVLYQVSPGTYQITSSDSKVGGFRWCPLNGYGWRKNSGECK